MVDLGMVSAHRIFKTFANHMYLPAFSDVLATIQWSTIMHGQLFEEGRERMGGFGNRLSNHDLNVIQLTYSTDSI